MLSMHVLTFWRQREKSQGKNEEEKEGGEVLARKDGRKEPCLVLVCLSRSFVFVGCFTPARAHVAPTCTFA